MYDLKNTMSLAIKQCEPCSDTQLSFASAVRLSSYDGSTTISRRISDHTAMAATSSYRTIDKTTASRKSMQDRHGYHGQLQGARRAQ